MSSSMFINKKRRKLLNVNFYNIKWICASDKPKEAEWISAVIKKRNRIMPFPSKK
jgi:hypothetical protein